MAFTPANVSVAAAIIYTDRNRHACSAGALLPECEYGRLDAVGIVARLRVVWAHNGRGCRTGHRGKEEEQ